jgi:methionyl-tRNA formyltransferase
MDLLQPERASDPAFCDAIRDRAPDILIVVAFGQILKRPLLEIPRWGALNIHASLLPRYRGAAPIQWAILNNETRTGLTAIRMDEGMDTGPILLQEEVGIGTDETAGQLHDRLSALSAPFLLRVLEGLAKKEIRERPQDPGGASFTGKIDPHMARIRWERPAREIAGLIRALDPWPGARTRLGRKEIKLFSPRVLEQEDTGLVPGRVKGYTGEGLEIETGGGLLRVGELQAPGKKRLPAEAFLRGFTVDSGTLLGK